MHVLFSNAVAAVWLKYHHKTSSFIAIFILETVLQWNRRNMLLLKLARPDQSSLQFLRPPTTWNFPQFKTAFLTAYRRFSLSDAGNRYYIYLFDRLSHLFISTNNNVNPNFALCAIFLPVIITWAYIPRQRNVHFVQLERKFQQYKLNILHLCERR